MILQVQVLLVTKFCWWPWFSWFSVLVPEFWSWGIWYGPTISSVEALIMWYSEMVRACGPVTFIWFWQQCSGYLLIMGPWSHPCIHKHCNCILAYRFLPFPRNRIFEPRAKLFHHLICKKIKAWGFLGNEWTCHCMHTMHPIHLMHNRCSELRIPMQPWLSLQNSRCDFPLLRAQSWGFLIQIWFSL